MHNSIFIVNGNLVSNVKLVYDNNCLSIKSDDYLLNISFSQKLNFTSLKYKERVNISEYLYLNQSFVTDKYSYVIAILENVFITRVEDNNYLFELYLPKVEVLIPPFNNITKIRENVKEKEIKSIEIKGYFTN